MTDFTPNPLVISLADASDRWAAVRDGFAEVDLQAERFDAVDGRAEGFAPDAYAPHGATGLLTRWELKRSEQAVFESHRAAWQRLVNHEDQPYGVICEDDILVSELFRDGLEAADVMRFGVVKLDGFNMARRYGPEWGATYWPVRGILEPVPSAACYAVSRLAAQYLLAESESYSETLDDFLFRRRPGVVPVQLWPAVAVQAACVQSGEASEREARDAAAGERAPRGPVWFRLAKEAARLGRKISLSRSLPPERPALVGDLPPYLD